MELDTGGRAQVALGVHFYQDGGDFQQRVGLGIESPGFHVDNDGQKAAET
jgi:hypothetical protein